jgi:acetyl-CoA C-acetyltransferase
MIDAYIVGVGQVPVVKQSECSVAELGARAITSARHGTPELEPTALYVGNMLSGMLERQSQFGAVLGWCAGLREVEAFSVDAACGSGAAAARWGLMAVWSGAHEVVAVCGAERMSAAPRAAVSNALATASDWQQEGSQGETFLSLNARLQGQYVRRYGWNDDAFGAFSVNAHQNASLNPYARFRAPITLDQYRTSEMIREQLRVHDAAPVCDGAACVLLATRDVALRLRREGKPVVRVAGSSSATDSLALVDRKDPLVLSALAKANSRAFASARISVSDVDIYEPHDAFSIMTVLSLEASGFAQVGRGVALGDEIGRMARLPTSTMGGLKARGHPVGASGIYQLVEAFLQLTGNAGQAQVPNGPSVAVTQNLGGTGATATVHVLARE